MRTEAEVDDVRAEWEDRFGPLPGPAAALVDVARLRVECIRLGITEVSVSQPGRGMAPAGRGRGATARLSPVALPASAEVRLRRLAPGSTYQSELHRLLVPVAPSGSGAFAPGLVGLLRELVPEG